MIRVIKRFTLKNDGPWGPANDDKQKRSSGNRDSGGSNGIEGDLDEIIKKGQEIFKSLFGGDNGSGGGTGKGSKGGSGSKNPPVKTALGIVVLVIFSLWMATGFYKVDSDENALVLYFGKFYAITTPGLNYRIPSPFGKVIKKSVTKVNVVEFGVSSSSSSLDRGDGSDGLMLTGDENIVDIDFQVQWQISDIKDFVFNVADTRIAIKKSAESAMREIIARTPIASALSDGKQKIERDTKLLLQEILDSYGVGVRVILVQMLRVDPPKQVIDSFRDVQTARADKEKEINQSQAYNNDIIPRARGEGSKLIQEAEAYRETVVSDAIGQSSRFLAVYREYSRAKVVTKRRIYLETMEKIYEGMDKIIIDKSLSKSGIVPYLPLNEMKK